MTATAGLHRPAIEVRRIRAELAALRRQLAELGSLLAAHFAADPGEVVTLETARRWSADAYDRGRAEGIDAGRLAVIAELKTTDRTIHATWRLESQRWGPGGRSCFAKPRPGDFEGRRAR